MRRQNILMNFHNIGWIVKTIWTLAKQQICLENLTLLIHDIHKYIGHFCKPINLSLLNCAILALMFDCIRSYPLSSQTFLINSFFELNLVLEQINRSWWSRVLIRFNFHYSRLFSLSIFIVILFFPIILFLMSSFIAI